LAGLGIQVAHGGVPDPADNNQIEIIGKEVIPAVADL
jgi:hypothetical protein